MENTIILTEDIVRDIFKCGAEWGAWKEGGVESLYGEPLNENEIVERWFVKDVVDINKPLDLDFVQFELYSKDEYRMDINGIGYSREDIEKLVDYLKESLK